MWSKGYSSSSLDVDEEKYSCNYSKFEILNKKRALVLKVLISPLFMPTAYWQTCLVPWMGGVINFNSFQ